MCPGRFALQSATTTRKGQFHVREKQQKPSQSLARTMNELIKQMRKQINPPRESASETRDPFRSRVINGAHKKEDRRREAIGFEIPVTRGAFDQGEGSTDDIKYHKTKNNTGRNVLWNTDHELYIFRKVGERKQLNQPRSW